MKRKGCMFLLLIVILIIVVVLVNCMGGKKTLAPGTYQVTQAVYEVKDRDYELQVKGYGEYDVKTLTVVKDASKAMTLEVSKDLKHTLYVKSDSDVIQDVGSSSKAKKKKR